MKNNIDKK